MSNTLPRSRSSPVVSRSNSRVPRPARLSTSATYRLRALCRPLPLPCANSTNPDASLGTVSRPGNSTAQAGMTTSMSTPASTGCDRPSLGRGAA